MSHGALRYWGFLLYCTMLLVGTASAHAAGPVINEVLFDPEGTDTGNEWIEIYNSGEAGTDLTGWELYPAGIGYFSFPKGFVLGPRQFAIVRIRVSGTNTSSTLYHATPVSNMGNTAGSAALFSGTPRDEQTIKSFVQWGKDGQTWESTADKAGLWRKGEAIDLTKAEEGQSIALAADGVAGGTAFWKIAASPTRSAANGTVSIVSAAPTSSAVVPSESSSRVAALPSPQTIEAHAGRDTTGVAGGVVNFRGTATGLTKEPIENARFWWNFGDGATAEGYQVAHVFRVPGTYLTGLHVSSGMYAASDYVTVTVIPNKVEITDVTGGADGFIRIRNGSDVTLDIGGWILKDGQGASFILPPHTMIRAVGEMALTHAITGLAGTPTVSVFFPDGSPAFTHDGAAETKKEISPPVSAAAPSIPKIPLLEVATSSEAGHQVKKRESVKAETAAAVLATTSYEAAVPAGETASSGYFFLSLAALGSAGIAAGVLFLKKFLF